MHAKLVASSLALTLALACGTTNGNGAEPSAPSAAESPLQLQVFTASPEGFLVNATLVSGTTDAVLIDSHFLQSDARKLAAAIQATGKDLKTVYVTHHHPDHYFGFTALQQTFPNAKLVALPQTVAAAQRAWQAEVAQWKPMYKDDVPAEPVLPTVLAASTIELEGEQLELVGPVQGDSADGSYVWIPSLRTVVAGDAVYDRVHPWTAETDAAGRAAWVTALDGIEARAPARVVPGHQTADRGQDPENIAFTRAYLRDFDAARAGARTSAELQAKIKEQHPGLALDVILQLGADAQFKGK